jgi:transcription elongation factor GreA
VRHARLRIVETQGHLIYLVASVASGQFHAIANRVHFFRGHRLESACNLDVLSQDLELVHSGDRRRDRQAHRVAKSLFHGQFAVGDRFAVAAQRLHPEGGDSAPAAFGQNLLREAQKVRIKRIERHLYRVEREAGLDHLQVHGGVFVAGETNESDFALLFGFAQSLGCAVWPNEQVGIVVPTNAVDLPEVEVIGLQPSQGLLQHFCRQPSFPAVSADFRHEKDLVAATFEALAHPVFGLATMVFPAVVEEGDAAIDGFLDDANRGGDIGSVAEVVSAETECRDTDIVTAERLHWDGVVAHEHSGVAKWRWKRLDGASCQKCGWRLKPACRGNWGPSIMTVAEADRKGDRLISGYKERMTMSEDPLKPIKQKLQDEITALEHELNVELPKEIAVARAHGDLSENAEYKFAKERQGFVNARIGALKKRMGDLGMLNLTNIPKDRAGYGSKIIVLDMQKDIKIEYKLVSSEEADVEKGMISTTSPIGRALLNKKVGDEIQVATPAGQKEFEVVRLVTIHDER